MIYASFGLKGIRGLGDLEASNEPRKAFSREKIKMRWYLGCHQLSFELLNQFQLRKKIIAYLDLNCEFGEEIRTICSQLLALEFNKCAG